MPQLFGFGQQTERTQTQQIKIQDVESETGKLDGAETDAVSSDEENLRRKK